MDYAVKITSNAIAQISETIEYISKILLVPDIALAWSDHLKKEIKGLCFMPKRFPLVDNEPWKSHGIRKMMVKNFFVYYWIDDDSKAVWITAVVYGRRDQIKSLKEMPLK